MLKDAFEWVQQQLGRDVMEEISDTDKTERFMNGRTGEVVEIPRPHSLWNVQLSDIDSLKEFHESHGGVSTAFVGESTVVVFLNDDAVHRNESATLPLLLHPAWKKLRQSSPLAQKRFLEFLRVDLFATELSDPDLLGNLKKVRIEKSEDSESSVNHGDEEVSKTVRNKATGVSDIPESVIVSFEPYLNFNKEITVQSVDVVCAVIIDTDRGTFHLRPMPGELERADIDARNMVRELVKSALPESATVVVGR